MIDEIDQHVQFADNPLRYVLHDVDNADACQQHYESEFLHADSPSAEAILRKKHI